MSSGQMTSLYTNSKIKSIINIAHGEGFGLPFFGATREGLPFFIFGWSGQKDFLKHDGKEYFQSVNFEIQPIQKETVWPGVLEENTMWAYADQGSYKMTLRKTYKNWDAAKETAEELKLIVNDKFSDEKLFEGFVKAIVGENKFEEEEFDLGIEFEE